MTHVDGQLHHPVRSEDTGAVALRALHEMLAQVDDAPAAQQVREVLDRGQVCERQDRHGSTHSPSALISSTRRSSASSCGMLRATTVRPFVERDAAGCGTHVPVVGIGHLARAVDDASHDADLEVREVRRARLDVGEGLFDVVKRAAATRAGDVLGVREPHARRLQDHQLDFAHLVFGKSGRVDPDAVGQPVEQQHPRSAAAFTANVSSEVSS